MLHWHKRTLMRKQFCQRIAPLASEIKYNIFLTTLFAGLEWMTTDRHLDNKSPLGVLGLEVFLLEQQAGIHLLDNIIQTNHSEGHLAKPPNKAHRNF